jgi:hypothetical protein
MMHRRYCLLLACVLTACSQPHKPPPQVNLTGFPPAFKAGHAAGCRSATEGTTIKDNARFAKDPQYASGWRDGFDMCRKAR